MQKGSSTRKHEGTSSFFPTALLTFGAFLLPGMRARLRKFDEVEARVTAGLQASMSADNAIRLQADLNLAAYSDRASVALDKH